MATPGRRYSREEFAHLGDALYESHVRPYLTIDNAGKFVAIEIETGAYEIGEDELEACDRLRARVPQAQIWLVRAGSRHLHRFGGRERQGEEE